MPVALLDPRTTAALEAAPLTYPEVGGTATELPGGYSVLQRTTPVSGSSLASAEAALMGWQIQARAGIRVAASTLRVRKDAVVVLRIGAGPLRVTAPCRVVYVVDEPHRRGFAYGTLPGHPESGEESFVLTDGPDGIRLTIRAFSSPATTLSRAAGPLGRFVQLALTRRYLRALDNRG